MHIAKHTEQVRPDCLHIFQFLGGLVSFHLYFDYYQWPFVITVTFDLPLWNLHSYIISIGLCYWPLTLAGHILKMIQSSILLITKTGHQVSLYRRFYILNQMNEFYNIYFARYKTK